MENLVQYFGAAYVINLKEREDRLASAREEFARAQWQFGPKGVQVHTARRFTDRAGFPSPQVRGCFYSHWECLRAAFDQKKNSVLVMEDDIALASPLQKITPAIISQLDSTPWDILYLGHEDTGYNELTTSRTSEIRFVPYRGVIRGCHFYAVHNRIFVRLLDHLHRVATGLEGDQQFGPMPIDGALSIFRRNNSDVVGLIAVPKIGWPQSSRSDITPRFFDNLKLTQPLISVLRKAKNVSMRWNRR